ncbi:CRISPR system Cascade subunit CasD [Actinoalloteichus hoggarensis]|uniref:CRISPR system Cascade subunit CasD n=1 Tax=Actinoalloteichus hoggarensis TaxID=1470176 RepID=A0A221W4I5_9PSEU|nr:type I-E CRISPR-associated protein Cas5/CasD [Actinoalloteichus hoggarensis]ASO20765.1 CRISPR system Cascade subunit CasD [Actinoalloteichus hoggarensis]MBB5920695.1 CRISPR system Cascade subunit CasD [Actinoalloteichus hoggarensis]
MSGLLLRLAGPLQSWGERSAFDVRDTAAFPTRSGLIGIIAASMGIGRDEPLAALAPLSFTVRIDRPGTRTVDYQTAGGALPPGRKIPTADGKGRPPGKGTVQTWREYLADAVFVVAVQGPDDLLGDVGRALARPHWQPYLGRRSCPPSQPFLLRTDVDDPISELEDAVPLARVHRVGRTIPVDFVYDTGRAEAVRSEARDAPSTFATIGREHRRRPIWTITRRLPSRLGMFVLEDYPPRLASYLRRQEA